jgi:hypothetical protein
VYACIFLRTHILASMKNKGQRTRDGGTEGGKQRSKGQEQCNRAAEKGTLGQLIGVRGRRKEDGRQGTDNVRQVKKTGDKEQNCETGDR